MVFATSKHGGAGGSFSADIQTLSGILYARRVKIFVYGFLFAFVACTAYLAFNPSPASSPWFGRFFSSHSSSEASSRPQFSSVFSDIFPDPPPPPAAQYRPSDEGGTPPPPAERDRNAPEGVVVSGARVFNLSASLSRRNETKPVASPKSTDVPGVSGNGSAHSTESQSRNRTVPDIPKNETGPIPVSRQNATEGVVSQIALKQSHHNDDAANATESNWVLGKQEPGLSLEAMKKCDLYDGKWVKDESYPLYKEGSCPLIDEQFDCFHNGRPDKDYLKFRWQPNACHIPRLNATDMLEKLRGRRLVFVGDSLNRNMWESLVCVLRNSVEDKSRVFEASGRQQFRSQGAYSFVFKDYNCSVEFFWSPFLVQEWAVVDRNGSTRDTLRLDLFERKSEKFRKADVVVFNTGHWWTHEKTSLGKDYYQEGNHVHSQLNVVDAFRKALVTWTNWVDANVDPQKTLVLFRGYSDSHFSGGQWNSGGACDNETEPIDNETYLKEYPEKMKVLETVLNEAKTPISYLNITRLTDYRKDGHPSIYRKRKYSAEERRSPLRYQDCSHWCLPGVPDSWNELLYAELLIKLH